MTLGRSMMFKCKVYLREVLLLLILLLPRKFVLCFYLMRIAGFVTRIVTEQLVILKDDKKIQLG